jgi:uncharacterized protein
MIGFEWDDNKAATNLRDHGVSFQDAVTACRDPFAVEWIDTRRDYGEERISLLGQSRSVVLFVAYTERSDILRIISARRATKNEQDDYYRQNAS